VKIICAPRTFDFAKKDWDARIVLFSQSEDKSVGSIGAAIAAKIRRLKLTPTPLAWDFLSIALSCYASDLAGHRQKSPDGWTRVFDLTVSVSQPDFWSSVASELEMALQFLTTDIWSINFVKGGYQPKPHRKENKQSGDSVALLSGGLDSLIGAIDLSTDGFEPVAVSQIARGDKQKQIDFPKLIGGGLDSILLTHGARIPNAEKPASQRSRSIVFVAYSVLVASCIRNKSTTEKTNCYISENGFISLNPPLTPMRIGSLSTRTTHPFYLSKLQHVLDTGGFQIQFINNYSFKAKGEMMLECADQKLLQKIAHTATSCGRFLHFNYKHCGRCVPCLVRRAAFLKWGVPDRTAYKYSNIGLKNDDHAGFDDVRATAIACLDESERGTNLWAGATVVPNEMLDQSKQRAMLGRGLEELRVLLVKYGVI